VNAASVIAIVDDDPSVRGSLLRVVTSAGYEAAAFACRPRLPRVAFCRSNPAGKNWCLRRGSNRPWRPRWWSLDVSRARPHCRRASKGTATRLVVWRSAVRSARLDGSRLAGVVGAAGADSNRRGHVSGADDMQRV